MPYGKPIKTSKTNGNKPTKNKLTNKQKRMIAYGYVKKEFKS